MAMRKFYSQLAASLAVSALIFLVAEAHAQSADSILQKTRDTYGQMKSYADSGMVVYEYGASSEDKHSFSTAFSRSPRHFLLDFHKQGGDRYVIWADSDAFHTWWKTTGQHTDYPNPNNSPAISLSDLNSQGTAMKIPTLLYGKAFGAAMLNIADPTVDGTDEIDSRRCHRITGRLSDVYAATGKEVNIRKVTIWIDAESFLIRKLVEESKPLPGQRSRKITIYEPRANPTLDDAKFKFTPPIE
jgi:outer membrane lipoprotein-sorting protein